MIPEINTIVHALNELTRQIGLYKDRIYELEKALDFYHCGCAEGTCNVTRPKFKGIRCGMTARKALEGKDD